MKLKCKIIVQPGLRFVNNAKEGDHDNCRVNCYSKTRKNGLQYNTIEYKFSCEQNIL